MKPEIEQVLEKPKIPTSNGSKIIYVCGPYRGKTDYEQIDNIYHAQRVALRLWELGWVVFCPHLNTANFNWYSNLPDDVWLNGGLKLLGRCDCMIMLKGWEQSKGANAELELAIEKGLEIYYE